MKISQKPKANLIKSPKATLKIISLVFHHTRKWVRSLIQCYAARHWMRREKIVCFMMRKVSDDETEGKINNKLSECLYISVILLWCQDNEMKYPIDIYLSW